MVFEDFPFLGETEIDLSDLIVELAIVLVISIGICIWIFFDARRRGINPKPWIILTLLIWILGLIGYIAFRRQFMRHQSTISQAVDLSPNRTGSSSQPRLANRMDESLQGALLLQKDLQGARNSKERKEQKEKKYCEKCGALIHPHATHCSICGSFTVLAP